MSTKRIVLVLVIGLVVFAIAVGVSAAQGNGNNGNNGGNGSNSGPAGQNGMPAGAGDGMAGYQHAFQNQDNCLTNYEYCAQRNEQQRSRMEHGPGMYGMGGFAGLPPAFDGELPQDIVDLMVAGWQDEQHAYAVYGAVIDQFGSVGPFVNIQQAEAQHIAAWEFLFERYEISVPEIPAYDIPEFTSVANACQAAADAEIANFGLYDEMLSAFETYPDLYQVTQALRNASEFNHLPAFERCAGL